MIMTRMRFLSIITMCRRTKSVRRQNLLADGLLRIDVIAQIDRIESGTGRPSKESATHMIRSTTSKT
jgi:hypothetical protein